MARLLTRSLDLLGRVFRLPSGLQSLGNIDLDAPIQPVLDISRWGERGAIETSRLTGGFFHVGQDNTHPAADTQSNTVNPYASLNDSWGIDGERWVWLMYAAVQSTTAAGFTAAYLTANLPVIPTAMIGRDFMLGAWQGAVSVSAVSSTLAGAGVGAAGFTHPDQMVPNRPFPLFPGSTMTFRSLSSAALTVRLSAICWVGPTGVYPPGL